MLLIRTKNGHIEEVEPRFICGRFSGFLKVNSNIVYDYDEVSVLSDAEIEAIRQLPVEKLTYETYGALEAELLDLKNRLNKSNDFETLGSHLRNVLSPYKNLIQILEELCSPETSDKQREILKKYLVSEETISDLKINFEHILNISHLEEVENIDWRKTRFYK